MCTIEVYEQGCLLKTMTVSITFPITNYFDKLLDFNNSKISEKCIIKVRYHSSGILEAYKMNPFKMDISSNGMKYVRIDPNTQKIYSDDSLVHSYI